MRPITFDRSRTITLSAGEICAQIADITRWREFNGYGILPGIASAEYETRTESMIGSRIRVRNTDGSEHIEEICDWESPRRIVIKLHAFSPPLSHLSTHFLEEWRFQQHDNTTLVIREFRLFPRSLLARPLLWLISLFFRRAITLHLDKMSNQAEG